MVGYGMGLCEVCRYWVFEGQAGGVHGCAQKDRRRVACVEFWVFGRMMAVHEVCGELCGGRGWYFEG